MSVNELFVTCESEKRDFCVCVHVQFFGSLVWINQLIVTYICSVVLVFTICVLYDVKQNSDQ